MAAAAGALALVAPAPVLAAGPHIIYSPAGNLPAYITPASFRYTQDFGTGATNSTAYTPGAGESVTGDVRIYSTDVSGEAFGPPAGTGNFIAILNGSFTVNFGAAPVSVFSFLLGGLDAYNKVTLNFVGGGTPLTLTGREIIGLPFTTEENTGETGRVTYDFGSGPQLASVVFSSEKRSFELDGLISAAPEPAAWGMMIIGFGIAGGALRLRRRDGKLARA
jgi:hypothetical protein